MLWRPLRPLKDTLFCSSQQAPKLSNPQHERGADNNYYPVNELQTNHIEETLNAWQLHHTHLSDKDERADKDETIAVLQMQCASLRLEGARIEEFLRKRHRRMKRSSGSEKRSIPMLSEFFC